jgi:hemoglobin-like flavoprotein
MPDQSIDYSEHFNDSFEFILKNGDDFYGHFYDVFFESSTRIPELFKNASMPLQKRMLKMAIAYMVNFFVTKNATEDLINLAKRHQGLGVTPGDYDAFVDSFVQALKVKYPYYAEKHGLSWRITLAPGIEFMRHYR